jgi:ParB family transcriptional regulator, chromosome partitioning protein
MMAKRIDWKVEMIAISEINVLSSRARNKRQHQEIVENIEAIGLKRPITVRKKEGSGDFRYDLVCGEGRLEAFRLLGQTEIAAVVIDASDPECLLRGLVENIARRKPRPIEAMQEIGSLHKRGYTDVEIAAKIGASAGWVGMIVALLERGEERLIAAVESGLFPLSFAVEISRSDSSEIQNLLMDAYESGKIKGKKLTVIRRLLDQRLKKTTLSDSTLGRRTASRRMSTSDMIRLYQREAEKQRLLVRKSDYVQAKLLFVVEALKDLLADEGFMTLLRAEGLATMPRALESRISGVIQS